MESLNKKLVNSVMLIFALILVFSSIAYAKPFTDAFSNGLIQVNNFFSQDQYKTYGKAIDFFFFSLLFIAIYTIGARYAFKDIKRPEQVIAILLGLMTAFLLVLGGFSATILIPYIHWLLYALLFILYWWLLKGIKSKFWRFILALLLTLLTIGLIQGLFDSLTAPDTEGFFKSFGGSFRNIELPGVTAPGIPSYIKDLYGAVSVTPPVVTPPDATPAKPTPTGPTPAVTPPEEKSAITEFFKNWWWLLLIPLLIWAGKKGWNRLRKKAPPEEKKKDEEKGKKEEKSIIIRITNRLKEIIELKQKILKNIVDILNRKKKLTDELLDLYHKKISDPAFLMDRESTEFKNLMEENDDVTQLLRLELQLEEDLVKLRKIEGSLTWELKEWSELLADYYAKNREAMAAAPEWYLETLGKLFAAIKQLYGVIEEIKLSIVKFFLITKKEEEVEKWIKDLTDYKKLQDWLKEGRYERWRDLMPLEGTELKRYFEAQEKLFFEGVKNAPVPDVAGYLKYGQPGLNQKINLQLRYLQLILNILKFLQSDRKSFTQLQELNVAVRDPADPTKWKVVNKQLDLYDGLYFVEINEESFKVYTNFAEGIPPFKVSCYVDGVNKYELPTVTKKVDVEPVVQFISPEHIGAVGPGLHILTVVAVSPGAKPIIKDGKIVGYTSSPETTYRRHSVKRIKIYIRAGAVPLTPTPATPGAPPGHAPPPVVPHVTPTSQPTPASSQVTPDVNTFFDDIFIALLNKMFDEVERLIRFGFHQRILNISQANIFMILLALIRLPEPEYDKVIKFLSLPIVRKSFEPRVDILDRIQRIVENLRSTSQPQPPSEISHQPTPAPEPINIRVNVEPAEATHPQQGVEVGTSITFTYEVTNAALPLHEQFVIEDEKHSHVQSHMGAALRLRKVEQFRTGRSGRYTLNIKFIGRDGRQGIVSLPIYVMERTTKTSSMSKGFVRIEEPKNDSQGIRPFYLNENITFRAVIEELEIPQQGFSYGWFKVNPNNVSEMKVLKEDVTLEKEVTDITPASYIGLGIHYIRFGLGNVFGPQKHLFSTPIIMHVILPKERRALKGTEMRALKAAEISAITPKGPPASTPTPVPTEQLIPLDADISGLKRTVGQASQELKGRELDPRRTEELRAERKRNP